MKRLLLPHLMPSVCPPESVVAVVFQVSHSLLAPMVPKSSISKPEVDPQSLCTLPRKSWDRMQVRGQSN